MRDTSRWVTGQTSSPASAIAPDGVVQLLKVGQGHLVAHVVALFELPGRLFRRLFLQDHAGEFRRRLVEVQHLGGIDQQHAVPVLFHAQVQPELLRPVGRRLVAIDPRREWLGCFEPTLDSIQNTHGYLPPPAQAQAQPAHAQAQAQL